MNDNNEILETFINWAHHKYQLELKDNRFCFDLRPRCIYWVECGVNLGIEQNKLRPVIMLWKSADKRIFIGVPLTSKRLGDSSPYHVDLEITGSTVLVEQIRLWSSKRIIEPFRRKGRLIILSKEDNQQIIDALIALFGNKSSLDSPVLTSYN